MTVPQDLIAAALLDPARPVPEGMTDGAGRPAGRRFDVYRNNVVVSLTEALATGYPVIARLLGPQNMAGLARLYLRAHPPTSRLMADHGADFPAFLAGMPQLAHLGYLPDVARLELALRQSYHSADAAPMAAERLAALDPERLLACRVGLAPALRLVRADWPIFDIWRFNTEDGSPKPRHQAQDVLVLRPEFDPEPHLLAPGGAEFVAALQAGRALGAAGDAGLAADPAFDLAAPLALLIQGGAVISLAEEGQDR
jgi:hypothetical protein